MRTHIYRRRLHWSECDPGGIIFVSNYLRWMVDGLIEMFLAIGVDPNRILSANTRGGLPVLNLNMQFHSPAMLHQIVTHEIAVAKIGGKSLEFRHRFLREKDLLMEAHETRVWATHSLTDPSRISTLTIPEEVRRLLSHDSGDRSGENLIAMNADG